MGMFTKLFSKSYDPYELKGRWYRVKIVNGSVVETDLPNCTTELALQSSNTVMQVVSTDNKLRFLSAVIDLDRPALADSISSGSAVMGTTTFGFYYNIKGINVSLGTTTILNQCSGYIYLYAVKR